MVPFLYSKFMVPIYFFCFQTIEVGFVDTIEFKYVNPTVFYQHNFPDILGISRGGACDAFISGVKCCPPLLIPCGLKILALSMNKNVSTNRLFKVHAWLSVGLLAADLLVLYTFNSNNSDIYRNHTWLYRLHAAAELASLSVCIFL
ncbi:Putative uncharacterized protein [Cardinium endosymbiont cEper1 of Encarsia pergandiella]|nr:Putative uncharacterized protein [Cardinium endosymbiont cEper1 of Encarsia pergandiella]